MFSFLGTSGTEFFLLSDGCNRGFLLTIGLNFALTSSCDSFFLLLFLQRLLLLLFLLLLGKLGLSGKFFFSLNFSLFGSLLSSFGVFNALLICLLCIAPLVFLFLDTLGGAILVRILNALFESLLFLFLLLLLFKKLLAHVLTHLLDCKVSSQASDLRSSIDNATNCSWGRLDSRSSLILDLVRSGFLGSCGLLFLLLTLAILELFLLLLLTTCCWCSGLFLANLSFHLRLVLKLSIKSLLRLFCSLLLLFFSLDLLDNCKLFGSLAFNFSDTFHALSLDRKLGLLLSLNSSLLSCLLVELLLLFLLFEHSLKILDRTVVLFRKFLQL